MSLIIPALYAVFFLSGAAALIFERLWFQQAGLALGNSVWASSLVLAAFMGGLALGSGLAARFAERLRRPMHAYGWLEAAVGGGGLALVVLLPGLTPLLAPALRPFLDLPAAINAVRLGLALVLLLIPSTAMGATLPVVAMALERRDPRFGRTLGRLYGWNTCGAVAGTLLVETVLLYRFGVRGTAVVAALGNAVAMAAAWRLSAALDPPRDAPFVARQSASRTRLSPRAAALIAAAFLSGAIVLGLEVVWFRFLLLFVDGTGIAFAFMLSSVLAGIALGGLAASIWLARRPEDDAHLAAAALVAGSLVCLVYATFDLALRRAIGWSLSLPPKTAWLSLALVFPVSFVSGVLFPLAGAALHRQTGRAARSAGLLTLANTAGAMVGALTAGFVLLPGWGIERSMRWLAGSYALVAALALLGGRRPRGYPARAVLAVAGALFVAAVALFPTGLMEGRYLRYPVEPYRRSEQAVPVAVREGMGETIVYLRIDRFGKPFYYRLLTNGFSMSASHFRSLRYMKLFVYWPIAVHPDPRSALLLCYGVGGTAKALTDTRALETIDVVDVSPDVLDLGKIVYPEPRELPLNDPRVRVHVEDARQFLQLTDRRFDVITGEPPPPGLAGVTSLYTVEYFRLLHDRLAEGGIATYWLPVANLHEEETKSIVRAFCAAFDDCSLWSGSVFNWMLVGTRDARGPVQAERFAAQWRDPVVEPSLRALGFESPEQLGALFIADGDDLRGLAGAGPALDDDHPKLLRDDRAEPGRVGPIYAGWVDVSATRERFARSPLVRRLWPGELRDATVPFFEFQGYLNALSFRNRIPDDEALPMLHRILTASSLRTIPMILLGDLADQAGEGGKEILVAAYALTERSYADAADAFERAQAHGDHRRSTARYRIYALCMAGRRPDAREFAARAGVSLAANATDTPADRFLASICSRPEAE